MERSEATHGWGRKGNEQVVQSLPLSVYITYIFIKIGVVHF